MALQIGHAPEAFGLCRLKRGQIMVFLRNGEATVVHVAAQPFEDTADKGALPVRGHRQKLSCYRCCRCEAGDQFGGSGMPHRAVGEAHTNIGQSRSSSQLAQFLCLVEREGEIERRFRVRAHILAKFLYQRDMEWLSFVSAPDAHRKSPARNKDPSHLLHGGGTVRKVLQPLLAQYEIETAICERHRGRAALAPLYLGVIPGDAQHTFVDIDPGDRAEFLAGQSHTGGDKARAASDVQNPVAILRRAASEIPIVIE